MEEQNNKELSTAPEDLLGAARKRYAATGHWRDLEEGLRLAKLALESPHIQMDAEFDMQYQIAILLRSKYQNTKVKRDLWNAIEASKRSVSILPASNPFRSQRLNEHLRALKEFICGIHDILEIEQMLEHIDDLFDNSVDATDLWTRTNRQLVTNCLSRKYEISGKPLNLRELALNAMAWWEGSADPSPPFPEEATVAGSEVLPPFIETVSRLVMAPTGDSSAIQISNVLHCEYNVRVAALGPRMALVELARDVKINVEIVVIYPQEQNKKDEFMKECLERFDFAKSIGATTVQLRTKFPWVRIIEDGEPYPAQPPPEGGLVFTRAKIKNIVASMDATKNDRPRSPSLPYQGPGLLQCPNPDFYEQRRANVRRVLNQAQELRRAYLLQGQMKALEDAVDLAAEALRLSESDEFEAVNLLFKAPTPSGRHISEVQEDVILHSQARFVLAVCLKALYQRDGDVDHLNLALDEIQKAHRFAAMIPNGDYPEMNLIVSRFGLLLRLRFLKFGRLADIDLAVQRMEEALNAPRSSMDKGRETNDLELLSNYALTVETRFDRTGTQSDIEKCVKSNERVLSLLLPDDPAYPDRLCSLSGAYSKLFEISKDTTHLDTAMAYARKSIPILRMNPQAHIVALNDVGSILCSGFHTRLSQGEGPLDYDLLAREVNEAIDCIEEALRHLPQRHYMRGTVFFNLARLLQSKNAIQPSEEIQARCLAVYQEAWSADFQHTKQKLWVGKAAARQLCLSQRWTEASAILEEMIQCMDTVAPRWLPSEDRLDILSEFHGIAADAAAARLMCSGCNTADSSVYEALRLLEMGRGVVLGSKLDYRSAARGLEAVSNGLAESFNRLTNELDALARFDTLSKVDEQRRKLNNRLRNIMTSIRSILDIPSLTPPLPSGSLESYNLRQKAPHVFDAYEMVQREINVLPPEWHEDEVSKRRKEASREFNCLLEEIRQHDGLQDFLRPLSLEATIALARNDHIVVVSSSVMVGQANAIIVNRDGITSIPLPELHPKDIEHLMNMLQKATTSWTLRTTAANNKKVAMVLKYLWVAVVNPVLVQLEEMGHLADELLPRVHWIGTGLLSGAPFHAAGDYAFTEDSTSTGACAMDYVVSSYTPTLRSLAYARESHQEQHGSLSPADRMLVVSAATVPGQKQLRSVPEEVMSIRAIASMASLQTHILDDATPASVLLRLPLANIVHFACHGEADPRDIENSHLVLHADNTMDGGAPIAKDSANEGKLTVREIQASKVSNATIAYISTCSGAESKASELSDEMIHIVNAFQLAGFEHVVGSLWKTKDAACRQVAEEFYRALWRVKGPVEPAAEVHHALHIAVQMLREKHRDKPLIWAPFVHYGG